MSSEFIWQLAASCWHTVGGGTSRNNRTKHTAGAADLDNAARIVALVADADQKLRHTQACHDLRGCCSAQTAAACSDKGLMWCMPPSAPLVTMVGYIVMKGTCQPQKSQKL